MSVRVVARVRPLLKTELDKDIVVTASGVEDGSSKGNTIVTIPNPKNEGENFNFQFNSVYEPEASQQELFEKEGNARNSFVLRGLRLRLTKIPISIADNQAHLQWVRRYALRIWSYWDR